MQRAGRFIAPIMIFALLLGTAWTGRATSARVDVDPALHAGDVALLQVSKGTAWTVAADLISAGSTEVTAFDSLDMVSARISDAALSMIGSDRSVESFGDSSRALSVGNAAIHAPTAWARSTGAGVVVALMDSGIGLNPDLPAGKVVTRVNFVADNASSLDPAGHGTHLAGVIAANGATFRGVAPDARLVDLRVLDKNGNGRLHDVVAAGSHTQLHANPSAVFLLPRGFELLVHLIRVRVLLDETAALIGVRIDVACHVEREQLLWGRIAQDPCQRGVCRHEAPGRC